MTLLEELGMVGPIRELSREDRLRYQSEQRRRRRNTTGVRERENRNQRERRNSHPDQHRSKVRLAYALNPEAKRAASKRWYDANREYYRGKHLAYQVRRKKDDPQFRARVFLGTRLSAVCRNAGTSSVSLNLSHKDLGKHLESLWTEGMSWDNYGINGWHIDHKLPCTSFDLTDPEEVRKCFALSNLQPMWAADNIRKSNKILEEYANAAA